MSFYKHIHSVQRQVSTSCILISTSGQIVSKCFKYLPISSNKKKYFIYDYEILEMFVTLYDLIIYII